jgi:hypothetical protein
MLMAAHSMRLPFDVPYLALVKLLIVMEVGIKFEITFFWVARSRKCGAGAGLGLVIPRGTLPS